MLKIMRSLGFTEEECLRGTGAEEVFTQSNQADFSLQHEFSFYRRILELSNDPLIGLKLGEAFHNETYGLLGYAMLSAETVADAVALSIEFSALTFSHFEIQPISKEEKAGLAFSPRYAIESDLIQVYCDRDVQACFSLARNNGYPLSSGSTAVKLMHNDTEHLNQYEEFFSCPVELGYHRNEVLFDRQILNQQLPERDADTSHYCRQQCLRIVGSLERRSGLAEKVRRHMVNNPKGFPTIGQVAKHLDLSERSLRRHLSADGTSYKAILTEVRKLLAEEYLESNLSVERIAELLGYSEAASFSNAFKRWNKLSPRNYRNSRLS